MPSPPCLLRSPLAGADLASVCREAALCALTQDLDATHVALPHFSSALVLPSAPPSAALAAAYERFGAGRQQAHGR